MTLIGGRPVRRREQCQVRATSPNESERVLQPIAGWFAPRPVQCGGCWNIEMSRPFKNLGGGRMHLVQILLPRSDNAGEPFANEDFDRVKQELADTFEGVTAYLRAPAEGVWRQGKESDMDEIVIFEVMTEEVDLPDWRRRRAELERRFRQEEIIIRYLPMALV
ncbi:hypothetical protein [Mesorhizobium sp. M7A.F.Ca.US.011.01.1.1]|uniref:hypothetical protein n=1 Tax=Mesorhizobium sp. M7A.F.Ca.US.011.01.1.1 TaxID=2496741 RepID=UPI0032AF5E85